MCIKDGVLNEKNRRLNRGVIILLILAIIPSNIITKSIEWFVDNCIIESFFGTLKNEMFYGHENEFKTFEQFRQSISEYIDYYNNKRIKRKTKWMSPSKFRETSTANL